MTLAVEDLGSCWPAGLGAGGRRPRVGALLHPASVLPDLRPTLDVLRDWHGDLFDVVALFGPQHGFDGTTQDNMIEWEGFIHPKWGVPVHSLYGEHREPTPQMLDGLDVLAIDLQDVGARYYTFIWTVFLCLRACEKAGVAVVVLDRPNPLGGVAVEGEEQDSEFLSFVGMRPVPVRHGKTVGELARQFRDECFPGVRLEVLAPDGWERAWWWDDCCLPWVMPSPNMPTLDTATVYPGMCLLEGTNVSEARGTSRPFEFFGAPWVDAAALCSELNGRGLPGCHFREVAFAPTFHKFAGETCGGAQLHVTDRRTFRPVETGFDVVRTLRGMWPDSFAWKPPPYEYETEKLPIEILAGGPLEHFFPD